ncbi:MAG: cysteine desulfurase [Gemmatimonadetes bacterium]|nr:cysteine desulfurase [Gemmatimonadota bacterium]
MHAPVCFDFNATTPVDERVLRAMLPFLTGEWGNAFSHDHLYGWAAAEAVEEARRQVIDALNVPANGVAIMSGATEALTTVIRSYFGYHGWYRKKIITCATEHDAVLVPSRHLCARTGVALEILPTDRAGRVDLDRLRDSLAPAPASLVALMAANNEIGTIHPMCEIAEIVHAAGGLFLCDTTQAIGKLHFDFEASGADFATVSAHKIYGPKGVGALLIRNGLDDEIEPLILGGGQERGVRGGTLNVPGIVGLGEACRLVQEKIEEDVPRMERLRDRLEDGILSQVPEVWINGDQSNRLCNTSNLGFKGIDGRTLIRDMHDIAVSTRSACSSGHSGPSHVLKAIGLSDEDAYSCIRFSLGRFTTQVEIDYTIDKVVASVHKLRRFKSVRA